jgi:DNA-binding LacI/PurR family transcriptional regulator
MDTDRPTMQTVAVAAGVSRMTVSNAYNRPDQLTPDTRERVLQTARRLGYPGPDPAAQSLRRRSTGTIGVVLTARLTDAFSDPGLVTILHGIASQLSDAGRALLLVPTNAAADTFPVRQAMADALVLCDVAATDPAVTDALSRRIPLVTIGHPRLAGAPFVGIDNGTAAALAADHLVGLGHRRFCVLTVAESRPEPGPSGHGGRPSIAARAAGFSRALTAALPAAEVIAVASANAVPEAAAAVRGLLALPPGQRPTALFATTDVLALGAMAAARGAGLAVPGELSVVGFDDIAESAAASPPLTTVSQALFEQGQTAARLALRLLAGERPRSRPMPARLIVRDSTAPPPASGPPPAGGPGR